MKPLALLAVLLLLTIPVAAQEKPVAIRVVGYDGLKEAVLQQRGKVVLVDFWADYCIPCKRNLPHLIDLYRKNADKGLAVITVSIDEYVGKEAVKGRLEKFLNDKQASFPSNLLLNEPDSLRKERLRFESVPTVYVFDRRGKWVQFTDKTFDLERIDQLVAELLNERP